MASVLERPQPLPTNTGVYQHHPNEWIAWVVAHTHDYLLQ
jgi:hypothetical protein